MGMGSMVMRGKCRASRVNRSRSMGSRVKYNMICNYKCIIYYIGFSTIYMLYYRISNCY